MEAIKFPKSKCWKNAVEVKPVKNRSVNVTQRQDKTGVFITFKRADLAIEDFDKHFSTNEILRGKISSTVVTITDEAAFALLASLDYYFRKIKPDQLADALIKQSQIKP